MWTRDTALQRCIQVQSCPGFLVMFIRRENITTVDPRNCEISAMYGLCANSMAMRMIPPPAPPRRRPQSQSAPARWRRTILNPTPIDHEAATATHSHVTGTAVSASGHRAYAYITNIDSRLSAACRRPDPPSTEHRASGLGVGWSSRDIT